MDNRFLMQWRREQHDAMLSLDKGKIEAYCHKYEIAIPKEESTFWIGVHKAITGLIYATDEAKQKSRDWLSEQGYSTLG